MSQDISALSLGALVAVQENDQFVPYQVAGKNVHGSNTVTLVRRNGTGAAVQWHSILGTQVYNQSNLDQFMRDFESRYSVLHRAELLNTSISYYTLSAPNYETISRKVFALSYTEAGFGTNSGYSENAQLPLFSSDASRIKSNLPAYGWWLRSLRSDYPSNARGVSPTGGAVHGPKTSTSYGAIPAHVVRSTLLVSDSPVSGVYSIIYPDSVPRKPILTAPVSVYADVDSQIEFSWQHVNDSDTSQTKADLEYSYEGGEWTTLATITGDTQTYTAPENTFLPGSIRWRARTYNTDDVAGEWSDPVAFIGVGLPPAPTITGVTNVSRPTVSWQSVGQQGYQLQLLLDGDVIYDTGETAGAEKQRVLPMYLGNDAYVVRIKIINASLLWSAWTEFSFTISATAPDTPTISVVAITHGARISVSSIDANATHVYLLRDGIPVTEITGLSTYDDYAGLGSVAYVVRVVDDNENCADSEPANVTVSVVGAVLAAIDELDAVVSMRLKAAGQPPVTRQKQLIGTAKRYAGREHPVFVFSEFSDETFSPAYYYTSFADWALLEMLVNRRQTVLYRDMLGNRIYGVVIVHNFTQEDSSITFVLTIQRVDYVEEIEYAEAGA